VVQGCTVYGAEDALAGNGNMRSHAERGNEEGAERGNEERGAWERGTRSVGTRNAERGNEGDSALVAFFS